MREKKKLAIIVISISAFIVIATALTLFLVELFTTPSLGLIEYKLDGYKYQIEITNSNIFGGDACFYIPSNGREINIPEEITVKHGMFSEKYIINEIYFDYDFYANGEDLDPNCLKTNIIVPKTVSSIRKKGFRKYTYAKFNDENIDFFVSNVGRISVASDNPYFDSREDSNCIIETKTDKIIISGLKNTKIPSTVKEIGSFAFWLIDAKEITIPSNVKKINSLAFMECSYLKKITIEEGVEEISSFAFVGSSCFYAGYEAFDTKIDELYIPSTIKEISANSFALFDTPYMKIYYNGSDFKSLLKDYTGWSQRLIGFYGPGYNSRYEQVSDGYFNIYGAEDIYEGTIYLYSENAPETDGLYWHYVDGKITVWE